LAKEGDGNRSRNAAGEAFTFRSAAKSCRPTFSILKKKRRGERRGERGHMRGQRFDLITKEDNKSGCTKFLKGRPFCPTLQGKKGV